MRLFGIGKPIKFRQLPMCFALFVACVALVSGVHALEADEGAKPSRFSFVSVGQGQPGDSQGDVHIGNFAWHQGSDRTPQAITYAAEADIWRFEVHSGENEVPPNQQSPATLVKDRSELWMLGNTPTTFRQGACLSFDMYLENVPVKAGGWTVLGQWHAVEDPGDVHLSPVLATEYDSGALKIVTRSDFSPRQSLPNKIARVAYEDSGYPLRQWVSWKYDIVFSTDAPTGSLRVWRDGQEIIDENNVAIGYNDKIRPRFQFGVYRGENMPGQAVVYYRNLHIVDGGCSLGGK